MPRPVWSGTISFGLVTIPVKLFHAVSRKSVSFNQLDDRSMSRIRIKKVSADDGEDVPDEHIVKGYEVSKGQYVVVDPDELEPFIPVATHSIDLEEFVDLGRHRPDVLRHRRTSSPRTAWPSPTRCSPRPWRTPARSASAASSCAASSTSPPSAAVDGHLMLSTMVYADEVVDPAAIDELDEPRRRRGRRPRSWPWPSSSWSRWPGHFEPERYRDSYREQVLELIGKKAAGEEFEVPEPAETAPKVIDLMAALEASVKAAKEHAARATVTASPGEGRDDGPRSPRSRHEGSRARKPLSPQVGVTTVQVGDRSLTLSNLDKVLYPETGFTKAEVIHYYANVAAGHAAAPRGPGPHLPPLPRRRRRRQLLREALPRPSPGVGGGGARTRRSQGRHRVLRARRACRPGLGGQHGCAGAARAHGPRRRPRCPPSGGVRPRPRRPGRHPHVLRARTVDPRRAGDRSGSTCGPRPPAPRASSCTCPSTDRSPTRTPPPSPSPSVSCWRSSSRSGS